MRRSIRISIFLAVLGAIALTACVRAEPPMGEPMGEPMGGYMSEGTIPPLSNDYLGGGVLYDHWTAAIGVDEPEGDHPLWKTQTTNTRSGKDTWRCKECHGWDYRGVEGVYGSGSHRTGFKGIMDAVTMSEDDLLAWMDGTKNPDHDFSVFFDDAQLMMVVDFVQRGVKDTTPYINADKTVNGDAGRGKELFENTCKECHGEDGRVFNFGSVDAPEYVGTIAADNPWEFWHKVSFGQPNTNMPSALKNGWPMQDIADVLAYAQTLPGE